MKLPPTFGVLLAVTLGCGGLKAAHATRIAGNACRPIDGETAYHLHRVRQLALGSTPQVDSIRTSFGIPLVTDTAADVIVVQDSTVCSRAFNAYGTILDASAQHATTVEVLKVKSVYIVSSVEGQRGIGEWTARVVFDSSFRHLNTYLM